MKCAIIFFSGTGNTKFAAEEFAKNFKEKNIACDLIDVTKQDKLNRIYDYYVIGGPLHAGLLSEYLTNWIKENIKDGKNKKCLVFETQASEKDVGSKYLSNLLKNLNLDVIREEIITMPNNYYIVMSKQPSKEQIDKLKKEVSLKVSSIVEDFLNNKQNKFKVSNFNIGFRNVVYKLFKSYSKNWAKNKLSIDYSLCTKCKKCQKDCPTGNIKVDDKISFSNKCISCQKCLHACPTNAFLYKGKHFDQYKL